MAESKEQDALLKRINELAHKNKELPIKKKA